MERQILRKQINPVGFSVPQELVQHLVSVIVPIYNDAGHLDECVNSIISQTWSNLEIILVDDGSTDDSYLKCLEWAKRDSRIHISKKENGGAASARNVGLKMATGDLLCFVDSDDFIDAAMIAEMIHILNDSPGCGLVISRVFCYTDGVGDELLDYFPYNRVYDGKYIPEEQYLRDILSWKIENFACSKLIRKEYSRNGFSEGRSNEDFMYIFQNAMSNHLSDSGFPLVGVAENSYYHYRLHESKFPNLQFDIIFHKKEVYDFCKQVEGDFQLLALQSYFDSCFAFFRHIFLERYGADMKEIKIVYSQFINTDFSPLIIKSRKFKSICFINKYLCGAWIVFVIVKKIFAKVCNA